MVAMVLKTKGRPGCKPGQVHSGSFVPGDPRINREGARKSERRRTFEEECRALSPKAINVLEQAMESEDIAWKDRLAAAELMIIYGHGRAVDRIAIQTLGQGAGAADQLAKEVLEQKVRALISRDIKGEAEEVTDV